MRIQQDDICEHGSSRLKGAVQIGGKSIVLEILKAQLLSHICLGVGQQFPLFNVRLEMHKREVKNRNCQPFEL